MPPSNLLKEQSEKLRELWEAGLTSTGNKEKISEAVGATGLTENTIKNWIGNERKRRNLASKRAPRDPANDMAKYVPCQKRKKSIYNAFKSKYLSSEEARKMLSDGYGPGEVQKQANIAYRQLTSEEKDVLSQELAEEEEKGGDVQIPRQRVIKKMVGNIRASMKTLDQLGCPSIWLGYSGTVPERLFSPQMSDLGEDVTFTNYVVATIVKKLSTKQMAKEAQNEAAACEKKNKRKKKKTSRKTGPQRDSDTLETDATPSNNEPDIPAMEKEGPPEIGESDAGTSSMPPNNEPDTVRETDATPSNNEPDIPAMGKEGNVVELLDAQKKLVCRGIPTQQTHVHCRALTSGWVAVLIQEVVAKRKVKTWAEYPTHSGFVEEGSFVAWRTDHVRSKRNISEAEVLKDSLHPDQLVSPGTIMSRNRQLRSRT